MAKKVIPPVVSNKADKGDRGDRAPRTLGTVRQIKVTKNKDGTTTETPGPTKPLMGRRIGRNQFED